MAVAMVLNIVMSIVVVRHFGAEGVTSITLITFIATLLIYRRVLNVENRI